jgi:O-antigen/teichoic acid export membrane protein
VRRYAIASLAFAVLLALALPALVPLVFGSEFSPAVPVAEVLLLGTVLMGAKDVLAGGAQAVGRPWLASRCELVALVVTAAGLAALLPLFGVMGAAIASVIAYGTALGLLVVGSVREFGLSLGSLARPTSDDLESLLPSLGVRLGTWRAGSRAQGAL